MIFSLAARHLRLFFRDRMGVFFSLLSALILFALYTFFLGNLQVTGLKQTYPGVATNDIQHFVTAWVFAGIIMISTLTTGLAALAVFVEDRASERFKDFAVSPLSKTQLTISYLLATFLTALLMSTIVFTVSELYVVAIGGQLLSIANALEAYGGVIILCLGFAAMSSFVVTFIRSRSAFSSLSTIVGTVMGFLAGAYIPFGTLPNGVTHFLSYLPFAQGASLIRRPFTSQVAAKLTDHHAGALSSLNANFGMTLKLGSHTVSSLQIILIFLVITVIFTLLGSQRLSKKIGS